jgi:hypothetical protein
VDIARATFGASVSLVSLLNDSLYKRPLLIPRLAVRLSMPQGLLEGLEEFNCH